MINLKYNIPLDIAVAKSCNAVKWRNRTLDWLHVVNRVSETFRTEETITEYFAMSKDKQDVIKNVGGFVGGKLSGGTVINKKTNKPEEITEPYGIRRKGHILHRQLVALDVDFGNLDVWLDFINLDYAGAFYSTHKHTPAKPRLRILFPLDRPVSPDEYEAIARTVASWLGIDLFDDTTYQPIRLMYYPSTSSDGEFLFAYNDAPVASADAILETLDDWTDPLTWARSSREAKVKETFGSDTVERPENKAGVIGAFCRVYSIQDVITEFLEEVYSPCPEMGTDRFSYAGGSTAGGLLIYDTVFAYSHHASDPAGNRLCNAFDLVRLHKFGDLDEEKSNKAMTEFASKLTEVKRELVRTKRTEGATAYDEIEDESRKIATADEWIGELECDGKGKIKNTIHNVSTIILNDENLKDRFGYNEFECREVITKRILWDKPETNYPRAVIDSDDSQLRLYLERSYGITIKSAIEDGLNIAIRSNSFHPVKQYLRACEWDGIERLDSLYITLFGADDTPYLRAITRKAFTAAVARIFNEGCKFDYVTVIVGEQGIGKSTALSLLAGQWFSDSVTTLQGKEAIESIQGAWLIELGELAGMRRAEVDAVKHFISKREDRYRVAYGKRIEYFPRRCVFFATTNNEDFLRDVTGNRRFWVVPTHGRTGGMNPNDYLDPLTVSQIWAEARYRFEEGETLFLDNDLEGVAKKIQDAHLEKDDRSGLISEYLDRLLPKNWHTLDPYSRRNWLADEGNKGEIVREEVCLLEIWAECLGKNPEDIKRMDSYEIAKILKCMRNWKTDTSKRVKFYGLQKIYKRLSVNEL